VARLCPEVKLPILKKGIILIVVAVVVAVKQQVLLSGAEFWIGVEIVEDNSNAVRKGRVVDYAISEGSEKELQWGQVVHGAARDDHKVVAKPIFSHFCRGFRADAVAATTAACVVVHRKGFVKHEELHPHESTDSEDG